MREDFWGFASDDSGLSSWQSRGLACVTRSNCRRLDKTLSGTLTNPKANCRPDKDKLSFSLLTGSYCRAKFTVSSLIHGQSHRLRTEAFWAPAVSEISVAITWGHKCICYLKPPPASHVSFMSSFCSVTLLLQIHCEGNYCSQYQTLLITQIEHLFVFQHVMYRVWFIFWSKVRGSTPTNIFKSYNQFKSIVIWFLQRFYFTAKKSIIWKTRMG